MYKTLGNRSLFFAVITAFITALFLYLIGSDLIALSPDENTLGLLLPTGLFFLATVGLIYSYRYYVGLEIEDKEDRIKSQENRKSESELIKLIDNYYWNHIGPFKGDPNTLSDVPDLINSIVVYKEFDLSERFNNQYIGKEKSGRYSIRVTVGVNRDGEVIDYSYHSMIQGISTFLMDNRQASDYYETISDPGYYDNN